MLPCQRHRFSIPDEITWLNCAYLSPLMHAVREAGIRGIDQKVTPWKVTAADFFADSEALRGKLAQLISAAPDDIALIPAVSYGIGVAAQAVAVPAGSAVVVLAEQFPSNLYPWRERAAQAGARIHTVPRPADADWTPAVLDAITEEVSVAALPHGHWTDGTRLDLVAIGARCRAVGAALVLDVTQSLGAVPLSVRDIQPDFLVCAAYKWLMGPYSLGFLYAHPRHHGAPPLEHNWLNRAGSQSFGGLVRYRDDFQPGARRFDVGERSNFVLVPMALAAVEQILEWGVDRIHATLQHLTDHAAHRAAECGLLTAPRTARLGNMIGVRPPDGALDRLPAALAAANIHVSQRGSALRISPHVYNTIDDIERFFEVVRAVQRGEA